MALRARLASALLTYLPPRISTLSALQQRRLVCVLTNILRTIPANSQRLDTWSVDWLIAFRTSILNAMFSPWEEEAAPLRDTLLAGVALRGFCWGWPALESLVCRVRNPFEACVGS